MRQRWVTLLVTFGCLTHLSAQIAKEAIHLSPNGKGWGVKAEVSEGAGTSGNKAAATNGISYHGGPEMRANPVNVYFIWYGNWTNGPKASDNRTTVNLLNILFGPTRGLGGSGYFKINTTYSETVGHPTGNISLYLPIGIVEVHHGERNTRITVSVARLERLRPRADDDSISLSAHPHRSAVRRAILHQRGQVSKIGAIQQLFDVVGECNCHTKFLRGQKS
jgi:hypothetical protein